MEKDPIDWFIHCVRIEFDGGTRVLFTDESLEYCKAWCRKVYKELEGEFYMAQVKSDHKVLWEYWSDKRRADLVEANRKR